MKILYESIIQSRFGDHKIEESILDIDAPDRLENDMKTGIKRQKIIQDVLKPVEDIIKQYHYSTQGGHVVTQDVYGLKGDIYVYEFTSTGKLAQDKKGVGVLQSMLKQAYRKYKPKNVDQSSTPVFQTSQFTFENLGMSIFICFVSYTGVVIRLCYQSDNKQTKLYIQNLVDKYTEPF
jgi:hypothetical protein